MKAGLRITPRDLLIIEFLGRYKVCTYAQLSRHFETTEAALRHRLPRLESAGWVKNGWTGRVTGVSLWTCTSQGLRIANLDLPATQVSWGTVQHSLGLVDLGIHFEREGELVVTEREIRASTSASTPTSRMMSALDKRARHTTGSTAARAATDGYTLKMRGRAKRHIPDMVLVRQPHNDGRSGSLAIELELNRKTQPDWMAILGAYRDNAVFDHVIYYVPTAELERTLKATVKAIYADHKIHVLRWQPQELTVVPTRH